MYSFCIVTACASLGLNQKHYEGATVGALVGGASEALLDKKNAWRGGVIGAGMGAIFGATISDISSRGSTEAYYSNRPVEYRTVDNTRYYRSEPVTDFYYKDPQTKCRRIVEKVVENGRIIRETEKEICEIEKTKNSRY